MLYTLNLPDIPRKTSPWGPRQLPSWDIDRLSGDAISPTNGDWRQQDTQLHDWQECGQDPSLTSQSESVGSQTILCLRNLVIQRKQKMFPSENGGLQEQDCWILLVWFWIHKANFLKNHRIMLKPRTLKRPSKKTKRGMGYHGSTKIGPLIYNIHIIYIYISTTPIISHETHAFSETSIIRGTLLRCHSAKCQVLPAEALQLPAVLAHADFLWEKGLLLEVKVM